MPEKPDPPRNPLVYLDVSVNRIYLGRVVIELRQDVCPRTCENFRALCTGEKGLTYKGSRFHKIVKLCLSQGGDIVKFTGSSGTSIYGKYFDDENFILKHEPGSLSMANCGRPNTNNSQFFITTVECGHLDGTNVVFGKVIKGLTVIMEMEAFTTDEGMPRKDIIIVDCGELKEGDPLGICVIDETLDRFPIFPLDWEGFSEISALNDKLNILTAIKEAGNYFYRLQQFEKSAHKYKKCTRYYNFFKESTTDQLERNRLDEVQLLNLNNLAATELKIESYEEVKATCDEAIKLETNNVKALYRRGIANLKLKNFDSAVDDLSQALKLEPGNREVLKELECGKQLLKEYRAVEKVKYQKMFQ